MNKSRNLLAIGMIFIFASFPFATGLSNGFAHHYGERINVTASIEILRVFFGSSMRIDLFPAFLGFACIFLALFFIKKAHVFFKRAMYISLAGFVSSLLLWILPLVWALSLKSYVGVNDSTALCEYLFANGGVKIFSFTLSIPLLVKLYFVFTVCNYVSYILILYLVSKGIYSLMDNYMYLEFSKDTKHCADVCAIMPLPIIAFWFGECISLPLCKWLALISYGVWIVYNVKYLYAIFEYDNELSIFRDLIPEKMEADQIK